ncbi:MAG: hypothetical protein QF492_03570 [Candidatus Krumholzibacteria bacterium]|nr:hypothetical protein [Candidatus Krumholzibacteria bacterium]MDP6668977.1 hypothetical protein [Candidatus Krumholzibacteria bacterium]MDP6796831.1 hypothetical protein [Candidatus Krumholzibacteria bacterium]MDP7021361.1 hypothetical protein [Candidatus Krumholzibacteria bacterium]
MSLSVSSKLQERASKGRLSSEDLQRFTSFVDICNRKLMSHPVITDNRYCKWFASGEANRDDVRHLVVQFSVFSNLFLIAQLLKMINAGSLEGMRASKEILANEIGVIFHKAGAPSLEAEDPDREENPDIVSSEGSVDGGTFRFQAAHFEWLLKMGNVLGLEYSDMGKRRNGTPSTIYFCEQLARIYGNEDPNIAEGASFAVENWAAAGFWKQLVAGLEAFKKAEEPGLPLAFFTWHDRIEDQHAGHVMDELEELFFTEGFDEESFLQGGNSMLDGVEAFWTGLNEQRIAARHRES